MQSPARLALAWADLPRLRRWVAVAVAIVAVALNAGIAGTPTLDWQHLYRPEDFHAWADLWRFLDGLQTGISPFWASLEIACQLLLGTVKPITHGLYPLCIGLGYYGAVRLLSASRMQVLVSAGLSLTFAIATRFIHKGNPQLYDCLMPVLILAWVATLQRLRAAEAGKAWRWALLAGLLLSILELTRTLVFPLMPLLLVLSFLAIRPRPITVFIIYLLPIVLLSGSWHAKQVVSHGQLHWSNHDGFNMQKSWAAFTGPIDSSFHDDPPLYEGGFENINTDKHTAYNQVVRRQVRAAVLQQPAKAAAHLGRQWLAFFKPKTQLFMARTPGWFDLAYRPAVWLGALGMLGVVLLAAWGTLRRPLLGASWLAWGQPERVLATVTLLVSLVFAVGEVGEEARFMISILPMLAALGSSPLRLRT